MRALQPGAAALGLLAALAAGVVLHNVLALLTLVVVQELLAAPAGHRWRRLRARAGAAFGAAAVGARVALARGAGDRTALAVGAAARAAGHPARRPGVASEVRDDTQLVTVLLIAVGAAAGALWVGRRSRRTGAS